MPGPFSRPEDVSVSWQEMNEIVCHVHFNCNMAEFDKHGNEVRHDFITYREWLARRNKLRTGKTL